MRFIVPISILSLLGVVALSVYLATAGFSTTLSFQVRDRVSQSWVWNAEIKLQNRVIQAFYQGDAGPLWYKFNKLKPGTSYLEIAAPGYEPFKMPVRLKRGKNRIDDPIDMMGTEIANLARFVIFEQKAGTDILLELRPVGTDGRAVLNHPAMDIRIGCRISAQMPGEDKTSRGTRGQELFRGVLEWSWSPQPEVLFRYGALIPGGQIKKHPAPAMIIDYLIAVPDPRHVSTEQLDSIVNQALSLDDPEQFAEFLESLKGRIRFFTPSSFDVARLP